MKKKDFLFVIYDFKDNLKKIYKLLLSGIAGYIVGLIISTQKIFFYSSLIVVILVLVIAYIDKKDPNSFDIVKALKRELRNKNWNEVVILAYPLSRPLWLSGRYSLRIKIGEIVKSALNHISDSIYIGDRCYNREFIFASILIDDLGWTKYMVGQMEAAVKNIEDGIDIAVKGENYDIAIKGYRHLAGIYVRENKFDSLEEVSKKLVELAPYISSYDNKVEIEANTKYTYAEIYLHKKDFQNAIKCCKEVQETYKNLHDDARCVKTMDLFGRIYMEMEDNRTAINKFSEGMEMALQSGRKERFLRMALKYFELNYKIQNTENCYDDTRYSNDIIEFDSIIENVKSISMEVQQVSAYRKIYKIYRKLKKVMKINLKKNMINSDIGD